MKAPDVIFVKLDSRGCLYGYRTKPPEAQLPHAEGYTKYARVRELTDEEMEDIILDLSATDRMDDSQDILRKWHAKLNGEV